MRFKIGYLISVDWICTRNTRPFEFWSSLFAFFIGFAFLGNESTIYRLSYLPLGVGHGTVFSLDPYAFGAVLIVGGALQLVGLVLHSVGWSFASRSARWAGCTLEAVVWAMCWAFTLTHPVAVPDLQAVFALLFAKQAWIVASIAYRGTRGGNDH